MPRARRFDLPGVALHVVQRGNDRQPCFFRGANYLRYCRIYAKRRSSTVAWCMRMY